MKFTKKSTLALTLTLLLTSVTPLAVYAACSHSPYSYTTGTSSSYSHSSQYGTCHVTGTNYYNVTACRTCGFEFSRTPAGSTQIHNQPHG